MNTQIEDLNKACVLADRIARGLLKSEHPNHTAYTRTSASGAVSSVSAKGTPKHLIESAKDAREDAAYASHIANKNNVTPLDHEFAMHAHLRAAKEMRTIGKHKLAERHSSMAQYHKEQKAAVIRHNEMKRQGYA